jgi:uncharacterized protein
MACDLIVGRNESDKLAFGKRGLAYLGKSYVKMGQYTSLSNPIFLDVARTHVILVAGKRGSGKSYSLATIAEGISDLNGEEAGNIASLIFDTMGIYWTMKFKNEKDKALLDEWGLKSKNVPVKVFAPLGHFKDMREKGISIDKEFAIKISALDAGDWLGVFNLGFTDPVGVAIERAISKLKEEKKSYSFEDIFNKFNQIEEINQESKNSAVAFFEAAKSWGVFDEKNGTEIKDLIKAGQTTIIDLSMYASIGSFNVRALVIGLVSKKLFNERMASRKVEEVQSIQQGVNWDKHQVQREMPLVWIFIDEAHEFLVHESLGKTPASDALIQILREGRQPGLSLILATQQPGKIHTDAITQSDIVISHKVTSELDVKALNAITQSYLYSNITDKINSLPKLKGSAIILDDNSERIYPMRVRPRFTWHGGEAPMAIKKEEN